MSNRFFSVITDLGNQKLAQATINNTKVNITHFACGDGNGGYYTPSSNMLALKNEVWRGAVTSCEISPTNPKIITISSIIPSNVGDFFVREMAVFDNEGAMIAICNAPETEKTGVSSGVVFEMSVELEIEVSNSGAVELVVDGTVVAATKEDVKNLRVEINTHKSASITSDDGVHGIRYKSNKLQILGPSSVWENVENKTKIQDFSIETTGWEEYTSADNDYKKKKVIPITGITADDIPVLNYDLASRNAAQDANASHVESEAGQIVVYAEKVPSKVLTGTLVIERGER